MGHFQRANRWFLGSSILEEQAPNMKRWTRQTRETPHQPTRIRKITRDPWGDSGAESGNLNFELDTSPILWEILKDGNLKSPRNHWVVGARHWVNKFCRWHHRCFELLIVSVQLFKSVAAVEMEDQDIPRYSAGFGSWLCKTIDSSKLMSTQSLIIFISFFIWTPIFSHPTPIPLFKRPASTASSVGPRISAGEPGESRGGPDLWHQEGGEASSLGMHDGHLQLHR